VSDRTGSLLHTGTACRLSRVFRHSIDALAVNAVYLRAASRASRLTPSHLRLEALRVAAGRASSRAEATLSQSAGISLPI
jgi:hypothetical protein